jgi:formiminotetrahydrofolate cyclodeaminase
MEPFANITIQVILAVAALVSMVINLRLNAAMNKLELQMTTKIDEKLAKIDEKFDSIIDSMRREIMDKFVPGSVDQERRTNISNRLAVAEAEIQRNRDKGHDLSTSITSVALQQTAMAGQMGNLETRLQIFINQSQTNHDRIARVEQASERRP